MVLGSKIREYRRNAGMSQEKLAELVGVSRQAVTKWEADQSAPSTENLFRLADVFGITVDMMLTEDKAEKSSLAEQVYRLYQADEEKKAVLKMQTRKRNILSALATAGAYLLVYLIGRMIWCDLSQMSMMGWLFLARPKGEHSYLYGWLLSSEMFWYAMLLSVLPALWGKYRFSIATTAGFVLGLILGILFGPYPEGAFYGHNHYGWAIWGITYLIAVIAGCLWQSGLPERMLKRNTK